MYHIKHILFLLEVFIAIVTIPINAQQKQGRALIPKCLDTDSMSVIDKGYIKIFYAFNAEDINDSKTYIDKQCLEIGENISKYYSFLAFHRDSLTTEWIKKHPRAQGIPLFFPDSRRAYYWSEYQYSEWFKSSDVITVYTRMPNGLKKHEGKYTESLPLQIWTLQPGVQEVCGFLCHKATCTFRGRQYIAWYTRDLPAGYGPWKFDGLPGLILKVYDSEGLYTFECIKIERFLFPIKRHNYPNYAERSRKEMLKLEKEINEDYSKLVKMRSMETGEYISRFTPYYPLELY